MREMSKLSPVFYDEDYDCSKPTYRIYAINHSGEHVVRDVSPISVWFGTTERHPQPTFFCHVFDHFKQDFRDFACSGIYKWEKL